MKPLSGIHHITAITGDAQQNFDFYTRILGLRLVKKTVNFDDPTSYHFYYGTTHGAPGTILTFFAWRSATPGRVGSGEIGAFALSVPRGSLSFWREHLAQHHIETKIATTFGTPALAFRDPDNIELELVESDDVRPAWNTKNIPFEYSIRGLHSATIATRDAMETANVLQEMMGFHFVDEESGHARFALGDAPSKNTSGENASDENASGDSGGGTFLDVVQAKNAQRGQMGAGTIHHIAFRASDDETQEAWRKALSQKGFGVSPIMDRSYFRSIYFREPGGVLFEIATDTPGFLIDESRETLGESLKLPPQYEANRARIEQVLPPLF